MTTEPGWEREAREARERRAEEQKHVVMSPVGSGGSLVPHQWQHVLEENRELHAENEQLKARIVELENLVAEWKDGEEW